MPVDLSSTLKILKGLKSGSPTDPCAARLLASAADIINPEVNKIINTSLRDDFVPATWKQAKILPLLKKPSLDTSTPGKLPLDFAPAEFG